jgi:CheY-like chemotaxis protein
MASPILEQREHRLSLRVPPEGLLAFGDPDRLAQVFANLLTNAARYTDPGGHIEVEAERKSAVIEARVRDDGIGIAPDMLPRVFDLFEQGGRSPDHADSGLGLGLSIVRSLLHLHGGSVRARSEGPGRGSELVVTLPALAPDATDAARADEPARTRPGKSTRILLVDDNRDAIEMFAEGLRAAGHEVEVAYDPVTGLSLAKRFAPEVLVLDIGLPVMDGYELARRLRELPALLGARFYAITGYGQQHDRARALSAGFDEHLTKPVSLETICALLNAEPRPE